jgi:hypothetical protein
MINSFEPDYFGKLNKELAIFYFRDKNEMLKFMKFLENEIEKFDIESQLDWRKACKLYQELKPELWKNEKELIF